MRESVITLLQHVGAAGRDQLVAASSRSYVDHLVARRELVAVFPRAYALPWDVDLPEVRDRAALCSVGGDCALSHLTALDRWDLPTPGGPLHVTAFNPRHPRGVAQKLTVHRTLLPLRARELHGVPVVAPAVAAVTSWPLLHGSDARAPIIEAARRGLVTRAEWAAALDSAYRMPGIRGCRELVGAIVAGCESELELYGYLTVFDFPGLRHARRQAWVTVGGRHYRLDMLFEAEQVVVELDGRAFHSGTAQWERDIARDLALATLGLQTVRLPHSRLTGDVDGVRRDVLAVLTARSRDRRTLAS